MITYSIPSERFVADGLEDVVREVEKTKENQQQYEYNRT